MHGCVIAGIGTGVGKTLAAAIFVERYTADYWKPVQAGELENSDSMTVARLADGGEVHPEAFRLSRPMSPHAAAEIDGLEIDRASLQLPRTARFLVVEPAGGLMVPLSDGLSNLDLIGDWGLPVVLVANLYLGSINHSLLSVDALRSRGIAIHGIVFNNTGSDGEGSQSSRAVIVERTGLPVLLDIPLAPEVSATFVRQCAAQLGDWQ